MPLPPQCVIDANIIIDFASCGLLQDLFGAGASIMTTDLVAEELRDPPGSRVVELGLIVSPLSPAQLLTIQTLEAELPQTSIVDRSAYVLARSQGILLLTGDAALRAHAQRLGLEVHGTLYLLDELVDMGLLEPSRAADALGTMLVSGSRLPQSECTQRLRRWRPLAPGR